ncbi:MAG: phosphoglucomutase/phosphomannomutase family protein [Bacteroidia bacterium]|nr:phosphoglucomutase/phosphomannomutase family protein [Bacteroidia bacterium]
MEVIKFGTDGWRAIIGKDFTIANLLRVTEGLRRWLAQQSTVQSVLLGYDCRFNGKWFAEQVATYLAAQGIKVFLSPGFVSTPMVSLATSQRQVGVGIILTASHNPPEYLGFKVKGNYGGPAYPSIISEIEKQIPAEIPVITQSFDSLLASKQIEYYDMEALYINHLKQNFDIKRIHSNLRIAYDAMFGAGQRVLRKILPTTVELHCEYNPSFLGRAPEPIERNLPELPAIIQQHQLAAGLATDGDADRIGLFDETGKFIDSHHILLLLIHYLHHYKGLSGKVVCTFSCTSKIQKLCELYKLPYQVTKIGFKYIAEIMLKEQVLVGGEESGGIAVIGHVPERDGIYIGLTIFELMAKTGKTLSQLIEEIYSIVGRFAMYRSDLHLTEQQKQTLLKACQNQEFQKFGSYSVQRIETIDGYKYHVSDTEWVMIRASGTEPVLRVYSESNNPQGAKKLVEQTIQTLLSYESVLGV